MCFHREAQEACFRDQAALGESNEKTFPQPQQPEKVTSLSGGRKEAWRVADGCLHILPSWEWRESGIMGHGGPTPLTDPPRGSASRRAICRVGFKKEVRGSFSKVRREMERFTSRDSAEG